MTSSPTIKARFQHRFTDFCLDVDLELPARGISAIFGPSGSGKTTLLRCMAGLERATKGQLTLGGEVWQDDGIFLPAHRRPLGYVFQEASLFPHLSAMGNLRYAMKRAPGPKLRTDAQDFQELVSLLGLSHLLQRHPHQLSGGERQRVAIARALLIRPRVLLMDEPLASLDQARKGEILPYLEALHRELTIPIVYVSHSVDEIMRLADYLVVISEGKARSAGAVADVMARPDFPLPQGDETGVVWEGEVRQLDSRWGLAEVAVKENKLRLPASGLVTGECIRLRVPASDVSLALSRHEDSSFLNILPVTVTTIRSGTSGSALVTLDAGGSVLLASLTHYSVERLRLAPGQRVWAQIKSVALLR